VFPKKKIPQNGWFIKMENPIKMDDLEVPLFSETPIFATTNKKKSSEFYGFTIPKIRVPIDSMRLPR